MDNRYDIPCLILYIKCIISYKYFKPCFNIWMRVEMLLYVFECFLILGNGEVVQKSGEHRIKGGVMKTGHSMRSFGQF